MSKYLTRTLALALDLDLDLDLTLTLTLGTPGLATPDMGIDAFGKVRVRVRVRVSVSLLVVHVHSTGIPRLSWTHIYSPASIVRHRPTV